MYNHYIMHKNEAIYLVIAILFFVLPTIGKDVSNSKLEGCLDPKEITESLIKLHNTNWRELNLEQLWNIWPTELHYEECNPGGCKTVVSQDRIINGICQCCGVFLFDKQGTKEEPLTKGLGSIIIYYASTQRSELVAIAKMFAGAFEIKEEDLKTIGRDPMQNFGWETTDDVGGITLTFENIEHIWVLNLYARQKVEK